MSNCPAQFVLMTVIPGRVDIHCAGGAAAGGEGAPGQQHGAED